MNKKAFILYTDQKEIFDKLNNEQAGKLIKAIFEYEKTLTIPKLDFILELAIVSIKQSLDRNREKHKKISEVRAKAGSKGGIAKASKSVANSSKSSNCYDNESEKDIDNDNDKEKDTSKIKIRDDAYYILGYLNTQTKSAYRPVDINIKLIIDRLKSGITKEELISIINLKCQQWLGDAEKSTWLRPATLFGKTKCEQYLGEINRLKLQEQQNA